MNTHLFPSLFLSFFVLVILSLTAPSPLFAQSRGDVALSQARRSYDAGNHADALLKYEEARKLYREDRNPSGEGGAVSSIGVIYYRQGEKSKALEYSLKAVDLFRIAKDAPNEALALASLARVYIELEDPRNALYYFSMALPLVRAQNDKKGEASALLGIGDCHMLLDDAIKALEFYNRAIEHARAIGQRQTEAAALSGIGRVYSKRGDTARVLDYFGQALAAARLASSPVIEAYSLTYLGDIYWKLGRPSRALIYFEKAVVLYERAGNKIGVATARNNMGNTWRDMGDQAKALSYYLLALPVFRSAGSKEREATTLSNIGNLYGERAEYAKAFEFINQALSIFRVRADKAGEGRALNNLGTIYLKLGEHTKALDHYNRALVLSRSAGDKRVEASILSSLMALRNVINDRRLALFYGKQSVNMYQQTRSDIKNFEKELQKAYLGTVEGTYRYLADVLVSEGRFAEAQEVLALLKEEEYVDYVRRDANEIKGLNARISLKPDEQQLIKRYNLIADKVTAIGAEFQNLDDRRRKLPEGSDLSPGEKDRYNELSTQLTDANAAFKLFLEKVLIEEFARKGEKPEIELDRALQEELRGWGEGTVALSTVAGEDRYRVILTTPNAQVDGKTEIKSADLNKKIFAFREALQNPAIDPRPLGKELYDILLKPIEKDLQAANAHTLVWSLDGTLRYLPLAALSPDGQTYLVEKYENILITSATRQKLTAGNESDWRALGLGVSGAQTVTDPVSPDEKISFAALPGVKTELTNIIREITGDPGLLEGKRLMDIQFTAQSLGDSLSREMPDGTRRYSVVHLASHFHLGSSSANSFLLLGSGNILTLEQISNSPQMKFGVELVTLSACNTAFGNDDSTGKEIDSLATFIERRGAKAILATLWPVVDESTQLIMSEFYRLHKENPNISKAEAIQQAQLAMLRGRLKSGGLTKGCRSKILDMSGQNQPDFKCDSEAPFAHPYFWSPFVLIGNWR